MRQKITPVPDTSSKVLSAVSQIPIFDSLGGDEIGLLVKHMGYCKAAAGEIVFEEGEDGDHVCFVVSGALAVLKRVDEAGQVALTTLKKGRSFGEMAMIDKLKRSATVRAKVDTNMLVMSRKQFDYVLSSHPAMGIKILKGIAVMLSQNLRKTATRLADYMLPLG